MLKKLLLSLSAAILLALPWFFPDFGGWTLFFAFVPLLILQSEKPRRFGLWAALTFVIWIALSASWVANSTPIAGFAVPIVGLFFSLTPFMIYHYVWKRQPGTLAWVIFVTAWIAFEALYTYQDVSFPWLTLGNGFAATPWLVQWYEYTGAFGGSAWVLVSNILIFKFWQKRASVKRIVALSAWIIIPAAISYTIYSLSSFVIKAPTRKVCIVQPNIDPYNEKFTNGKNYMTQDAQAELLLKLASEADKDVKYIVMPETAIDDRLWESDVNTHPRIEQFRAFLRANFPDATIIVGAMTYALTQGTDPGRGYIPYNSALWIDSTSHTKVYHKGKLVMGPELTPWPWLVNLLSDQIGGMVGNFGRSDKRDVHADLGVAICYESVYGAYFTEYVDSGAKAICIITNDGWWGDTQGYHHHLNYARLRAIETRRDIIRSANTGISAIINHRGDIVKELGWWQRGTINGTINLYTEKTFYTEWKDAIMRISILIFGLSLLYFFGQRFRNKLNK